VCPLDPKYVVPAAAQNVEVGQETPSSSLEPPGLGIGEAVQRPAGCDAAAEKADSAATAMRKAPTTLNGTQVLMDPIFAHAESAVDDDES
jgi:hypothetical protein